MDVSVIEKHLFQGKPLSHASPELSRLNPVHVGHWLAQKALSDPRLRIELPLGNKAHGGVRQFLQVLDAARPRLTGAEFDAILRLVHWVWPVQVPSSMEFSPQVALHGAVTFRWGRSCFALERDAQLNLGLSAAELFDELAELLPELNTDADEDGFSVIHRDRAGIRWNQSRPVEFSKVGQSLVVLGKDVLSEMESATEFSHLTLVQEAPELLELLEESEGPLVLRVFEDRVLVHVLYALPPAYADRISAYSYGLDLDGDPLEQDILGLPALLRERVSDTLVVQGGCRELLKGISTPLASMIQGEKLFELARQVSQELFAIEPVFGLEPSDPVGYDDAPRFAFLQAVEKNPLVGLSFQPGLLLSSNKTPEIVFSNLRQRVMVHLDAKQQKSARLLLSTDYFDLAMTDPEVLVKLAGPASTRHVKGVFEGLRQAYTAMLEEQAALSTGEKPLTYEDWVRSNIVTFTFIFDQATDDTPESLLAQARRISRDLAQVYPQTSVNVVELSVPTWGLMQSLQEGELADGNASRLMVL